MKSQRIAAVLATVIGLVVAMFVFAYGPFRNTDKSEKKIERPDVPKANVVRGPVVKGPVVRELPLPEK
jgi:hypothetical protein